MKSRMFSVVTVGVAIAIWSLSAASAMAQVGGAVGGKAAAQADKTQKETAKVIRLHAVGPGVIVTTSLEDARNPANKIGGPKKTPKQIQIVGHPMITVERRLGAPTRITLQQPDGTIITLDETQLGQLPDKVRNEVQRLLQHRIGPLPAQSGPIAGGLKGGGLKAPTIEQRLRRLEDQVTELRKQLEALRKTVEQLQK